MMTNMRMLCAILTIAYFMYATIWIFGEDSLLAKYRPLAPEAIAVIPRDPGSAMLHQNLGANLAPTLNLSSGIIRSRSINEGDKFATKPEEWHLHPELQWL